MKYTEVTFSIQPYSTDKSDILAAMAGEIGFESFTEMEDGLKAYIQDDFLDKEALEALTTDFPFPNTRITFTLAPAAYQNWNEEWEQHGFQPIVIDNRCCVHSTTHQNIPQTAYDIVINPQMSFGSGYHETTQGMIREILDADLFFIDAIGLREHLSPTRSNGLLSMVKQMRMYALAFKAKEVTK